MPTALSSEPRAITTDATTVPLDLTHTRASVREPRTIGWARANGVDLAKLPQSADPFRQLPDDRSTLPDDYVLIPGVIDSTSNFVEHPELIAQRVRESVGEEAVTDTVFFRGRATLDVASEGENVGLLLRGVERSQVQSGDVVQSR